MSSTGECLRGAPSANRQLGLVPCRGSTVLGGTRRHDHITRRSPFPTREENRFRETESRLKYVSDSLEPLDRRRGTGLHHAKQILRPFQVVGRWAKQRLSLAGDRWSFSERHRHLGALTIHRDPQLVGFQPE
jgi:hypothetical protein